MNAPSSRPHDRGRAVLVLAGGDVVPETIGASLPLHDFVIAADSGVLQARALGLRVDLAVGDFDSIDADTLRELEESGRTERHPEEKDKTDLELALDAAQQRGASRVIVVGGAGQRADHAVANALLLTSEAYADLAVEAHTGEAVLTVIRGRRELAGASGQLGSLLAIGGRARGVTTAGLRYALSDDELASGSTRGVSNEFTDERAVVEVSEGALLAIQPDPKE